ncbi:ABC transporter substrate-binding protein [Helicobacter jaachi]|uniref:Lipoprotein n=1 Tax=Helicobacter jaachi TaxID=1677920 RepID=A0A4U8T976_9HELI|nr:MetQ/NlpA family ABC transporter substrate-binding protein [Helicobacter jaachi]TLD96330.1 ABC transporter substrate-binding protein [Helicobacter jaachi]
MRNIAKLALLCALGLGFIACGDEKKNTESSNTSAVLRVGATPVPAAEILEFVKPQLAAKGVQMEVQSFTDYVVPNVSLAEGSSDANLYQHKPFLDNTNKQKGYKLVPIVPIYITPLGFYSNKYKSIDEFPQGATLAVPGDTVNLARALILFHKNGAITLKDPDNLAATELDILENPKGFVFKHMEAASLPSVLDSVDGAIINANYALQAGIKIATSLFHEGSQSIFANVLAAREDNKDDERIKKLAEVLTSDETTAFILQKYGGEIIPVNAK